MMTVQNAGAPPLTRRRLLAPLRSPDAAQTAPPNPTVIRPSLGAIVHHRLAFGPRPGDVAAFDALPGDDVARLTAWVDAQLLPGGIDDSEITRRITEANFESLHKTVEETWSDHIVKNPYDDGDGAYYRWRALPYTETFEATWLRRIFGARQLHEVLVDFWHNHFNIYGEHYEAQPLFNIYDRDVIRAHAFGNFRQFVEAVGTSASMLYYLDNYNNTAAGPNENYARELFELHTLGAENYLGVRDPMGVPTDADGLPIGYVDNDVYEAARCFTGWRVRDNDPRWDDEGLGTTGAFLYHRARHDRFNKLVLRRYLPADQADMKDGRDVLDIVSFHPGTARHICRKLAQRLIGDDPPEDVVAAAAATFTAHKDAPDQLARVVRGIVLSDAFRQTWGRKLKTPMLTAVATLRAVPFAVTRLPEGWRWLVGTSGANLFGRVSPDGYPDRHTAWTGVMSMLGRWNTAGALVQGWLKDEAGPELTVDVLDLMPQELRTAETIIDWWAERLFGRPAAPVTRAEAVAFLAGDQPPDGRLRTGYLNDRLPATVQLLLQSPDFQVH